MAAVRHAVVNIDVLAQEVSRRLCDLNDAAVLNDPHSHVLPIAADVETDRSTDAIPAPSASASSVVRTAVLALPRSRRRLLFLHLEGMSCRQIAANVGSTETMVLGELVQAYVHLRMTMVEEDRPSG
jgi:DNA-directed RNA polymerase specialized sigma24 family protein